MGGDGKVMVAHCGVCGYSPMVRDVGQLFGDDGGACVSCAAPRTMILRVRTMGPCPSPCALADAGAPLAPCGLHLIAPMVDGAAGDCPHCEGMLLIASHPSGEGYFVTHSEPRCAAFRAAEFRAAAGGARPDLFAGRELAPCGLHPAHVLQGYCRACGELGPEAKPS